MRKRAKDMKQSKRMKHSGLGRRTGPVSRSQKIKGSNWTGIWIRIGILALILLVAGIALITVAAEKAQDAEPAALVQAGQLQASAVAGNYPESVKPENPPSERKTDSNNGSDRGGRQENGSTNGAGQGDGSTQGQELTAADFPSPVQGPVLRSVGSYYSEEIKDYLYHTGTDYLQAEGAIITAARGGVVSYAGPDSFLGQKVEIDSGGGWFVTYGCLDNLRVKTGDKVEPGAILGQVALDGGPDAVSGQAQLHYEVRYGDEVIE